MTDRPEANAHAALVTKEQLRSEEGGSSENGPWLCHDEDDDIGSDCSSDVEFPPGDRPKRSCSKIEGLCTPPQHRVEPEKMHIQSVQGEDRISDFRNSDLTPTIG